METFTNWICRAGGDKSLTAIYNISKSKDSMYWFAGYDGAWKYGQSRQNLTKKDDMQIGLKLKYSLIQNEALDKYFRTGYS